MSESKILEFKRPIGGKGSNLKEDNPTINELVDRAFRHSNQDEAEGLYLQILTREVTPKIASDCYINLGSIYSDRNDYRKAADYFRRSVECQATYVGLFNLGTTLEELDKKEEAIVAYQKSLTLNPRYCNALFNLARLLGVCGEHWEAKKHWLRYVRYGADPQKLQLARELLED